MKISHHRHLGFSLIEVALALSVATFCLIIILGLLPVGLNSNQTSIRQTVAASLARGILSDLRATSKTASASTLYGIPIPTSVTGSTIYLNQNSAKVGTATGDEYGVTLFITTPVAPQKTATQVRILITWPGVAAISPANYSGSYEIVTAIDRN